MSGRIEPEVGGVVVAAAAAAAATVVAAAAAAADTGVDGVVWTGGVDLAGAMMTIDVANLFVTSRWIPGKRKMAKGKTLGKVRVLNR